MVRGITQNAVPLARLAHHPWLRSLVPHPTMPRQSILHVLFSPRLAGSERYCVDLANRQAEAGHEVHVAGSSHSPLREALSPKVAYHSFNRFLRGLRLRHFIGRLAPDICHGHLSPACKALKGVAAHQRTVATLHVGYKAHQHAWLDGLICVNHTQARRLTGYRGLAHTIPNWIPQITEDRAATGIRQELGLGEDVFLVGAIGRLHPSKGMDVLVSAFRESAPERAALVILGDGPQRRQLDRLRGGDPRIHFVGYRSAVHDCLRDLDLFVSPSREESFGLAIVEAMSAGVPIVATAAEGPGEFLIDQPIPLVPPGSIAALSAEIRRAHQTFRPGTLARIDYDLSLFDPSARLANVMEFYGQVIAAGEWSPARTENQRVALAT